ncbi:MAG: YggS family pyridoxal phosphate-dependent enzyme [Rhodospirillales bacterium]|nr:YggS family pyridoxal phosphate-dependent enzyme [Rhodospirillales bacterium]
MTEKQDIAAHLAAVKDRIADAARSAGRDPKSVHLVAVSKTKPADIIQPAIEAGQVLFGENRVQEAESKWPELKERYPQVRLHLVGPLQSNKIKRAISFCDAVESVDREKLARSLAGEMASTGRAIECFVQVNTGEEPQKAGVLPDDVDAFLAKCREVYELPIAGLMCIPPIDDEPALHFGLLAEMARRNGIKGLSMGMTGDFETAIRFGATHVRVGTAIFGARPPVSRPPE